MVEVWATVYENAGVFGFHHGRRAKALVLRIIAKTDGAITTDNRNTARCSCSEKSYFEFRVLHYIIPPTYTTSTANLAGGRTFCTPANLKAGA